MSSAARPSKHHRLCVQRFKTELCRVYCTEGSCPYGDRCMFAHGEAELRTPEQNATDGIHNDCSVRKWQRQQRAAAKRIEPTPPQSEEEDYAFREEDCTSFDSNDAPDPLVWALSARFASARQAADAERRRRAPFTSYQCTNGALSS